jgi:hypothetical protein
MKRHENVNIFGILSNQANNAPRHCSRTAVAIDEQIHAILSQLFAGFEVVIDDPKSVIRDLNFMTRSG